MKTLLLDTAAGFLFLAVLLISHDVAAAVIAGAAASTAVIGWLLARRRPIAPMQWLGFALVAGLGGVSLLTHDPRFVMVKPSIVQAAMGLAMLKPDWLRRYMSPRNLASIPPSAIRAAGYAYAVMVLALGTANLAVALAAGPIAWATYSSIVPFAAFSLMGAGTYLTFRRLARAQRAGMTATA